MKTLSNTTKQVWRPLFLYHLISLANKALEDEKKKKDEIKRRLEIAEAERQKEAELRATKAQQASIARAAGGPEVWQLSHDSDLSSL